MITLPKITMIAFLALIGIMAWYLFFPYNPLTVTGEQRILNENHTVCKGDNLIYEVDYYKNTSVTPMLYKSLVDGIIFHLSEDQAHSPTNILLKTESTARVALPIPDTAPIGEYYLNIDAVYKMNPLREITVNIRTEKFNVVDCK